MADDLTRRDDAGELARGGAASEPAPYRPLIEPRSGLAEALAPVAGFLLAVLSHGLWNLAAVTGGEGMVVIYLFVQVPIFCAFLAFVAWVRRTEGHLIGQFLRPYADVGWLSPAEVAMLSSMPHLREARV